MAEREEERGGGGGFGYRNIKLLKSSNLGTGSYGAVCRAECDGLLCAAKILHPTLFDLSDSGSQIYLSNFKRECVLLSSVRHPNIVQYLAVAGDPETGLPVLLMELCEENLTNYLEQSPEILDYHLQLDICHDIALALVYLHSNGLIHRDLTGNNVLMITGPRAKITDFGMSKLATTNPRMKALTRCPGNTLYMAPEALDSSESYTTKLDIFSIGIIAIQVITREFPNPIARLCRVTVPQFHEPLLQIVPEIQRRKNQLDLIADSHPLKQTIMECIRQKEDQRPSAIHLAERFSDLKHTTSEYQESKKRGDVRSLKKKLSEQTHLLETRSREVLQCKTAIHELQWTVERLKGELERKKRKKERDKIRLAASCDNLDTNTELTNTEELTQRVPDESGSQQQSVSRRKEYTVTNYAYEATTIKHPRNKVEVEILPDPEITPGIGRMTSISQPDQESATNPVGVWRKGAQAPIRLCRGSAVVDGNKVYLRPAGSQTIYSYHTTEDNWSLLQPQNPHQSCSLTVINGLLTSVGGAKEDYTGSLLSLTTGAGRKGGGGEGGRKREGGDRKKGGGERGWLTKRGGTRGTGWPGEKKGDGEGGGGGEKKGDGGGGGGGARRRKEEKEEITKEWTTIFPPMPTPRRSTTCFSIDETLVVIGGNGPTGDLDTVEILNTATRHWHKCSRLPLKCSQLSGALHCNSLYLTGGYSGGNGSRAVFSAPLSEIIASATTGTLSKFQRQLSRNVWKMVSSLPVVHSTLVSFRGELLAIGGEIEPQTPTSSIYRYDSVNDSWSEEQEEEEEEEAEEVARERKRSWCFALTLSETELMVAGGYYEKCLASHDLDILQYKTDDTTYITNT